MFFVICFCGKGSANFAARGKMAARIVLLVILAVAVPCWGASVSNRQHFIEEHLQKRMFPMFHRNLPNLRVQGRAISPKLSPGVLLLLKLTEADGDESLLEFGQRAKQLMKQAITVDLSPGLLDMPW